MSRTWRRATALTKCGGPCGGFISRGQPVFELRSPEWTTRKVRCSGCAGEPVPADLPPLVEKAPIQPTAIVRAGRLPFARFETPADFKMAAAGVSREPGEEG